MISDKQRQEQLDELKEHLKRTRYQATYSNVILQRSDIADVLVEAVRKIEAMLDDKG